jgi:hypothetical protein
MAKPFQYKTLSTEQKPATNRLAELAMLGGDNPIPLEHLLHF